MRPDTKGLGALARFPRTPLANLPTPLVEAPSLRAALSPEGPRIWLKRDDETGFALGGNKVRKLEMELAPTRLRGVTHIVTTGGPQSNHARVSAAAAASLGLRCILVIDGEAADPPRGNALLHRLFGAEIRTVGSRDEREEGMEAAARDVAAGGGTALVVPLGASTPIGSLGYSRAAVELENQLGPGMRRAPAGLLHVVVAASSCGTLGGLAAGFTLLGRGDIRLIGVSADVSRDRILDSAGSLAGAALELLHSERGVPERMIEATDDEVGEGYGIPTDASRAAIDLFARREGVLLDPVYSSKAAAAMVALVRDRDRVSPGDEVVFWHTGGHPTLLA